MIYDAMIVIYRVIRYSLFIVPDSLDCVYYAPEELMLVVQDGCVLDRGDVDHTR